MVELYGRPKNKPKEPRDPNAKHMGRPKGVEKIEGSGIKKGYEYKKLSSKQMVQRRKASKLGSIAAGKYKLMKTEIGKCRNCPIRDICTDREIGKVEYVSTNQFKLKGCNQAREIFQFHLAGLTTNEQYLVTDIAHLQTKLDMQEIKDGMEKMIFSPEWIKAKQLNLKQLELLHKLRENRGRKVINVTPESEVIEFNKEEDEKKFLRRGDMYIPDPKSKEKPPPPIVEEVKKEEVKPDEPEQPSKGDNPEGGGEETSEHSPSQGDNEDSIHNTSLPT
ncbi:hypothetical protein LCGC14_0625880 [marine sediment metagenome]|uniref:Uncharacterized protein n=1 Tax=marine sediment metagenome TaxID=412755 RepID=A0A0F9R8G5_9ZZZZ